MGLAVGELMKSGIKPSSVTEKSDWGMHEHQALITGKLLPDWIQECPPVISAASRVYRSNQLYYHFQAVKERKRNDQ